MMIYFDNNATTMMDPVVQQVYQEAFDQFGNPSSLYQVGREAKRLLDEARESLAAHFHVSESQLIMTSGATESLNTALKGIFLQQPQEKHLVISAVEHSAVLESAKYLASLGVQVTTIPVDAQGCLDLQQIEKAFQPNTTMLAVMAANNETGNLYPVEALGQLARERGAYYLCDAVQVAGKKPFNLSQLPIDFLALSAHKFHGPKGVGLLYVKAGIEWQPLLHGGRQERGHRAGTENLPAVLAMAKALELAQSRMQEDEVCIQNLRNRLQQGLIASFPELKILGDLKNRLSNTLNVYIPGISGESALINLDLAGIAISIGSACESGSVEPSHVLKAMGYSDQIASSGLRFSLSRVNTAAEVEQALEIIPKVLKV